MPRYDLVIANGFVVDGTGLPRRRADVGIRDGLIIDVGRLTDIGGAEVLDADGHVVAPGIIDVHTHYDPQVLFDPCATSSCFHGVTTAIAGNCGFSIAPCRPEDRTFITRMFARVEGMSPSVLDSIDWTFETFAEYVSGRRGRLGINLASYVGHSSVRRWVMGEAASERTARPEELDKMCALVDEALAAGAAGLSSSHSPTQLDGDGRPVPSRLSDFDELMALARRVGRSGSISYLPQSVVTGIDGDDRDRLVELALAGNVPVVVQGLSARSKVDAPTEEWPEADRFLRSAAKQGAPIFSLLRMQPFNRPFSLDVGTHLYDGVVPWREMMFIPHEEKVRRLQDQSAREKMRYAVENPNRDPALGNTKSPPAFDVVFVESVVAAENQPYVGKSVRVIGAEQNRAPADVMLDIALADDLKTEFVWFSDNEDWAAAVGERQHHPHMIIGVSDGGAHLDQDDGAEWSTYFLASWVVDRQAWTLEEGVRQITQVPAALCGLVDRGVVAPGFVADLFVFDPETIGLGTKTFVHDFPGGGGRFATRPVGIKATIVNGTPVVFEGQLTGALPGQFVSPVRGARRAA